MNIVRTWKRCTNEEILKIYDEIYAEAQKCGYFFTKPILYIMKSTKSWGKCQYSTTENISAIALNEIFLKKPEAARNTLIHEMAHSCELGDHHGEKWKKAGNAIGKRWGITVERLNNYEDLGVESIQEQGKYVIKCEKCGHEYHHARMCGVVRKPSDYRCGICHTDTLVRIK